MTDLELHPFTLRTTAEEIEDLRRRLRATRWFDAPAGVGWTLGADLDELHDLVDYWADGFDWPAQEEALARLPRVTTRVGGLRIHLVHGRPARPAIPLLLAHGWPDSFWRYSKVIPLLVDPGAHGLDPEDAFEVIVPDMPGYGYSEGPAAPMSSIEVAALWADLMRGLGHERFVAAGGDIGSHVVRYLALDQPDRVVAVHRTDAGLPPATLDLGGLTEDEREWFRAVGRWSATEGAYGAMHRTKPQTAAAGLTDSPVGLAAWIVEKLRAWSDCDGDVLSVYTRDEVLTLVSQYWFTGTIGSSMRMYAANGAIPPEQLLRRVEVPSGFTLYPADISSPPQAWLDRMANAVSVHRPERGGHFAAFEDPEGYARELRDFFRPFRSAFAAS